MKQIKIRTLITNKESDSIGKYFQEINKINLLTKEEEIELGKKIKETNDQKSIDKLIESNLRFVITVAKQFQNQGLTLEDLINEGNIGLIIAARKFDYSKGFRFISYAVWWIKQSILQSLTNHSRTIRLPLNQINNMIKIKNILNKLDQKYEDSPTNDEISDLLNIKLKKINEISRLTDRCISLDEPLNKFISSGHSENYNLIDIFKNENSISPDSEMIKNSITKEIEKWLEVLNEREKKVITLSFGLNNSDKLTLEAIGDKFDISKERIRQIKNKSIRKIRNISNKEL